MYPINFVFISCKVKKQESPEYYSVVNYKTLGSHLKGNLKEISNLVPRETKCPGYEVGKFHNFLKEISVKIRRKKRIFSFFKVHNFYKKCRKCSPGASRTGPQNPYIEISTQPRTQGIISQTPLGVGRKDPRAFLCACPGERCKKQLWNLFSLPRKVATNYYAFCPPGAKMS